MHARIEHLLSIRDGEPVEAELAQHVEHCPTCIAELQRLATLRSQMRALPLLDAPPVDWERIQLGLQQPEVQAPRRRIGVAAAVAAAVTLAVIAVVANYGDRQANLRAQQAAPATTVVQPPESAHVAELIAQSQQLDEMLQNLPVRPRIERVSTAGAIDTMEQRIQWLDFQLSYAGDDELSEEQSRQLWRERVELMDSLVKVRYAEAGTLSF